MAEVLVLERAVVLLLSLMGGGAGALVISTLVGVWASWKQVRELERQIELEKIQAEATILLLETLRGKRP